MPVTTDRRVLVDFRTSDDAGVYAWDEDRALVHTVDFFTPIVDDPFAYGQIAAANSLSDVYAMGGQPQTALAVAAFPLGAMEIDDVRAIFRGGAEKLREAGVALLGGHTVQDREVKFGYAVTGVVHPARVWLNAGARAGDRLVLTKPVGTGIVATAIKFQRAPEAAVAAAVDSMVTLNRAAAAAAAALPPGTLHACTDITGFGLVGHAAEMAAASQVAFEIDADAVPLLPSALELAAANRAGGLRTNQEFFGTALDLAPSVDPVLADLLFDPQTSGGLLFAVDGAHVALLTANLGRESARGWVVGRVVAGPAGLVRVG